MFVLVIGGGKIGANLAEMLVAEKHEVTVIEQDPARVAALTRTEPAYRIVEGDGCEPVILELAHISRADAVAAVTGDDEDNLVVCLLGRREYGRALTVARVNDPRNEWLFDARFGVDVAISNTRMISKLLTEEIGVSAISTLLTMLKSGLALTELTLPVGAPAIGKTLGDIALPGDVRLIAVVRDGQVIVPGPTTDFIAGDEILAISNIGAQTDLRKQLLGELT